VASWHWRNERKSDSKYAEMLSCRLAVLPEDQTPLNVKSIGRETSCDLVLEHTTASRLHARLELYADGSLSVLDNDSSNGTFLHRNDDWIRVRKVTLCVGDRIRFGDSEVELQQLTGLFRRHTNIKLGARHFSLRQGKKSSSPIAKWDEPGPALRKPKRNPLTGRIEEDRP